MNSSLEFHRWARDDIQEPRGFGKIRDEIHRSRAADSLVDLRAGGNSRGPGQRRVEHDPLQDRSPEEARVWARGLLAGGHAESICQVADHLVSRHPAPAGRAVGAHRPQPRENLFTIPLTSQSLQVTTLSRHAGSELALMGRAGLSSEASRADG